MTVAVGGPLIGAEVGVDAEALVLPGAGRPFERIGVPTVVLHHGELLVEVELALVCPSDVRLRSERSPLQAPLVLGHEQVGRIVAIGPRRPPRDVDGRSLSVGDRVVWGVAVRCGRCGFCHGGEPWRCRVLRLYGGTRIGRGWELSGSFATHVHLLARTAVVRTGSDLPAAVLAQAPCATAFVASVLERVGAEAGLDELIVVVRGAGLRALTAIAMAREAGALVVAVDSDRDRRDLALAFGAHAVADGLGVLDDAIERMPRAAFRPRVTLDLSGPPRYAPRHLAQAVAFLGRVADALPFAELVGEHFALAEAERAFRHAAEHEVTRVGVHP